MNVLCIAISSHESTYAYTHRLLLNQILSINFHLLLLLAYVHHIVTNLRAVNTTTSSATITWDQPPHNYRVFLHGEATDNIPQSRVIQLVNVTGQTTHIVEGLDSFRNYSIGIYLKSNLGQGSSQTVTFQTQGRGENAEGTLKCCVCKVCCSECKT